MQLPNPIDVLLHPDSFVVYGIFLLLFFWELLFPARKLPKVKFWPVKGLVAFFSFFLISVYLPLITDGFLAEYRLIDLTSFGVWGGALAAFFSYEVVAYFWHRTMHRSNFLWKGVHQMHHSPERLDSLSAFYFSPFDMIAWTLVTSIALVFIVGVNPTGATYTLLLLTFFGIFTHANIRTPVWLGFLIQRPESHAVHHQRGVHNYNFAELPVIDMIFGTFRNPLKRDIQTGFYEGGSDRVLEMVQFKDVSNPK